jgi:DNA-binding XRE family transcriptional regulator
MQAINRVREVRRQRDLTQEQVCAEVGISRWTLIRIEAGRVKPNSETMLALARVLDSDLNTLFMPDQETEKVEAAS